MSHQRELVGRGVAGAEVGGREVDSLDLVVADTGGRAWPARQVLGWCGAARIDGGARVTRPQLKLIAALILWGVRPSRGRRASSPTAAIYHPKLRDRFRRLLARAEQRELQANA